MVRHRARLNALSYGAHPVEGFLKNCIGSKISWTCRTSILDGVSS